MLQKYQPTCNSVNIKPEDLLFSFKKHDLHMTDPSIYSMVEWICLANKNTGKKTMTIDDFLISVSVFYSERTDEGLKYIFLLID